VKAHQL